MKERTPEERLQNAIQVSGVIERRIDDRSPNEIATDARTLGIGQLFVVMAQHHRAIRTLIEAGDVDASARALLRPLLEAISRSEICFSYKSFPLAFDSFMT
jgi:DNA-binding GntR family transcriptional regulator